LFTSVISRADRDRDLRGRQTAEQRCEPSGLLETARGAGDGSGSQGELGEAHEQNASAYRLQAKGAGYEHLTETLERATNLKPEA
jgi:hypothetical protein